MLNKRRERERERERERRHDERNSFMLYKILYNVMIKARNSLPTSVNFTTLPAFRTKKN